ncbi:hypothetical protein MRY82_10645 [bacterium]|nr:hypothetical protein [bacterium]
MSFYTYTEDACSEKNGYVWQKAHKLEQGSMRLYQGEEGQLCPIHHKNQYTVEG